MADKPKMGILGTVKAANEAAKLRAEEDAAVRKQVAAERSGEGYNEFLESPVGRARAAYERGDRVFQFAHDVMSQQAVIVGMVGSATMKKTRDPSEVLNAVCDEGWDLVNGSFVFIAEGEQSRDKFLSSGQNVAVRGRVVGYYLFQRAAYPT